MFVVIMMIFFIVSLTLLSSYLVHLIKLTGVRQNLILLCKACSQISFRVGIKGNIQTVTPMISLTSHNYFDN